MKELKYILTMRPELNELSSQTHPLRISMINRHIPHFPKGTMRTAAHPQSDVSRITAEHYIYQHALSGFLSICVLQCGGILAHRSDRFACIDGCAKIKIKYYVLIESTLRVYLSW